MTLPSFTRGLSAQLLILTAFFVMLAEVFIFAPSVARYRLNYLEEKLSAGHLAALSIEAAPDGMVTKPLEAKLLAHVGAYSIDLIQPGVRVYMLAAATMPAIDARFDLSKANVASLIVDAFDTLARRSPRVIQVAGTSPKDASARVEVVLDERPMRDELFDFAGRILGLSVVISLITAGLVFLSLNWLLVRPMRRITASMMAFRRDPDDPAAIIVPSGRSDEMGMAQRELADMQVALRAALRQKARLAALGTAVTKINHDLSNILSTAALLSERLTHSDDPEVRRVTPRLLAAIDRAVELCSQTLAYTRDGALPLSRSSFALKALVDEVGADVQSAERRAVEWVNEVAATTMAEADRDQIARVLSNLGRNAVQAGAGRVRIAADRELGGLVITIADDGPGLPPRARENLFQPFAGSARPGGTGLGLAIAREVMRAHGGDVRLAESTAAGSTFRLELPAGDAPTPARPASPRLQTGPIASNVEASPASSPRRETRGPGSSGG